MEKTILKKYLRWIVWMFPAMLMAQTVPEPHIERLFTTAAERNDLNQARERYLQRLGSGSGTQSLGQLVAPGMKFNGLVMRNDGKSEVWVNGKSSLQNDELGRELRTKTSAAKNSSIQITLPDGAAIHLRPGQIYYPSSKQVREGYQAPEHLNKQHADEISDLMDESKAPDSNINKTQKLNAVEQVFDESLLVKQVSKILLLEERIEELEKTKEGNVIGADKKRR